MDLLSELKNTGYSAVLKSIIKKDEGYNKKYNTLTCEELFQLCHRRYKLIEEILLPLKNKLGEDIEIIDIGFAKGMQEEKKIFVRYREGEKQKLFDISNIDGEIFVSANNEKFEQRSFAMVNRKMIQDTFRKMEIDGEEIDSDVSVNSASRKFTINDNVGSFIIRDCDKSLYIEGSHPQYENNGSLYIPEKTIVNPQESQESLSDEEVLNIYRHIHIYEEDIPKILIKTNQ